MKSPWVVFTAIGFEIIALILAGIYLGGLADSLWGWGGLGLTAGVIGALILWLIHVFVLLQKVSAAQGAETQPEASETRTNTSGVNKDTSS